MRILDDMIDFKYRKNDLTYFDLIVAGFPVLFIFPAI